MDGATVRNSLSQCWGSSQEAVIPSILIETCYKCTNLSYTMQLNYRFSQSDTLTFKNVDLLPLWLLPIKSNFWRTQKRAHSDRSVIAVCWTTETTAGILSTLKRNWWRNGLVSNISNFCNVVCIDVCFVQSNVMDCVDFYLAQSNVADRIDFDLLKIVWWITLILSCSN